MSLAKKCHVCGYENKESEFFCHNCGIDISFVSAPTSAKPAKARIDLTSNKEKRVCPKCNQSNDAVFVLCTNCGFDLSAASSTKAPRLLLVIGDKNYECKSGDVLGREGTVAREFFSTIGTVSRKHVTFTLRDGQWFLSIPQSVQNISQLDGNELPRGQEHPLQREHTLKLSSQCEVRLRVE